MITANRSRSRIQVENNQYLIKSLVEKHVFLKLGSRGSTGYLALSLERTPSFYLPPLGLGFYLLLDL